MTIEAKRSKYSVRCTTFFGWSLPIFLFSSFLNYREPVPLSAMTLGLFCILGALLSRALNNEMQRGTYVNESLAFFLFVESAFRTGSDEVKKCIDVAFVENLFWEVAPKKAGPYWQALPQILQKLYIDFHARSPL